MTQTYLSHQQGSPQGSAQGAPPGREGVAPVAPSASEATRLLCAGAYLDDTFRDTVIEELYVREERIVAPSLGMDAARVLAHALRARRMELGWAAGILLLWVVATVLSSGLAAIYLGPVLLLFVAARLRRIVARLPWYVRAGVWLLRWYGRLSMILIVPMLLVLIFGSDDFVPVTAQDVPGLPVFPVESAPDSGRIVFGAWVTLALPLVLAWAVATQRGQFARSLAAELSKARFPDMASDPAEQAEGVRFHRLRQRIRTEQHGPLVMYHSARPFCGAGISFEPWSLSVELKPDKERKQQPLDNRAILERIVPMVEDLRAPSSHGSPEAAAAVRDRLRELQVDQCVFLPVDGLPSRADAPYGPEAFAVHQERAIEEGGEVRRHFLRIRVGGWGEEIVTTVFVRVHTQGGMLMLEIAPHVLPPLRPLFHDADRIAHRYRHNNVFGKAAWALTQTPSSAGRAVVTLWRGLASVWRIGTGGHGGALPDGPALSVRELGADEYASMFQRMDVSRYLKSIQDRVAGGVRQALRDAGWQTDEFEQRVVNNINNGGTFIGAVHGAVGIGDHNTITHSTPQTPSTGKGPESGGNHGNG